MCLCHKNFFYAIMFLAITSSTSYHLPKTNGGNDNKNNTPSSSRAMGYSSSSNAGINRNNTAMHVVWPEIVWLMSFPNSGTYYTIALNQLLTGLTTGTNYGNEVSNVGIDYLGKDDFSYSDNGPFRGSRRPLPDKYILTKTHCSGHCNECGPSVYLKTVDQFFNDCAKGVRNKKEGDKVTPYRNVGVSYNPLIVGKAVHLIRSPFDNVVSRFHYALNLHTKRDDMKFSYSWDPDGFRDFCRDLDARFNHEEMTLLFNNDNGGYYDSGRSATVAPALLDVPCRGVFYQYVQWHNNAFAVARRYNLSTLIIHYKDYATKLRPTFTRLLDFLEQPHKGGMPKFKWNGGYMHFYSDENIAAIASFLKIVASKETYDELKRYIPKHLVTNN